MGQMVCFSYDNLAQAVRAFEKDGYHQETATFLLQLISAHPSVQDERFQALIERLTHHPQDPSNQTLEHHDQVPTHMEVFDLAKNFWEGTYREDIAQFLEQMLSSHPSRNIRRFRHVSFVLARHPQRPEVMAVETTGHGAVSAKTLTKLVKGFEKSNCDETVATALIELIGSHPFSSSNNLQALMKRVAEHPRGPGMLATLPRTHYFDMTAKVASVEKARDVSTARKLLGTIRERIPVDTRYEHLALRVQYMIDTHTQMPVSQKTARQKEQERRLSGWRQAAPRGLGIESTQRLAGGWRTVSGGLPNT